MRTVVALCLATMLWTDVAPAALLTEVSLSFSGVLTTDDYGEELERFETSCNTSPCRAEWTLANGDTVMSGISEAEARYGFASAFTYSRNDAYFYSGTYGPHEDTDVYGEGLSVASAEFQDAITFSGQSGQGLLRFVVKVNLISGTFDAPGRFVGRFGSTTIDSFDDLPTTGSEEYVIQTIPFTFGTPVPFGFTVSGHSDFDVSGEVMRSGANATLIGIRVIDTQGISLTEPYTFLTDSGTRYAIPEPTTGVLLGIGLCGITALTHRNRKRESQK